MTKLILTHDNDGTITDWRYEADEDYQPDANECVPESHVDHREIEQGRKRVDLSGDQPTLVDRDVQDEPALEELVARVRKLEEIVDAANLDGQ